MIEKIIEFFSPALALRRERARSAVGQLRRFDAASGTHRGKALRGTGTSADAEIKAQTARIRARAREQVRNNAWAKKGPQVLRTNTVGKGIRPAINHKSKVATRKAKELWKAWADKTGCDFYGKNNFYGIQRLVMNHLAVDGEVFVYLRRVPRWKELGLPMPIQLQVLEVDYLDTSKHFERTDGRNSVINGIEYDSDGRVVAYHLFKNHPGDAFVANEYETARHPASDILHIFRQDRAGQSRGFSELAAVLMRLHDLDAYEDAQLYRQKVAACFTAFITADSDGLPGTTKTESGFDLERLEPGIVERLAPGEEITFSSPPETRSYDEFTRSVLRGVSAGLGITYESLTNDLSGVNFSSGRMGWVEMGRAIQEWQELLENQLCDPVWDFFLKAAQIGRALPKGGRFNVTWTSPRREMLDPTKETAGYRDQVRAGFRTRKSVIREMGLDPDEVMREQVEEKNEADAAGLMLEVDPEHDPDRNPVPPEDTGVQGDE